MTDFTNLADKYNIYHNYNKKTRYDQAGPADEPAEIPSRRPEVGR